MITGNGGKSCISRSLLNAVNSGAPLPAAASAGLAALPHYHGRGRAEAGHDGHGQQQAGPHLHDRRAEAALPLGQRPLAEQGTHSLYEPAHALRERITFQFAPELDLLLEKATQIDPASRITMAGMAEELRACLAEPPEAQQSASLACIFRDLGCVA
jgi:hypothetical protein